LAPRPSSSIILLISPILRVFPPRKKTPELPILLLLCPRILCIELDPAYDQLLYFSPVARPRGTTLGTLKTPPPPPLFECFHQVGLFSPRVWTPFSPLFYVLPRFFFFLIGSLLPSLVWLLDRRFLGPPWTPILLFGPSSQGPEGNPFAVGFFANYTTMIPFGPWILFPSVFFPLGPPPKRWTRPWPVLATFPMSLVQGALSVGQSLAFPPAELFFLRGTPWV